RVKKLEKTVKQLRTTRLVGDAPAAEGDVDIQADVDIVGLSRMASAALGRDQPAVTSEDVEEREEAEVPLRRKRSAYRRARTEFATPAFEQFQSNLSAGGLPHTAVSESVGPSVSADKGKAHMPDLDIPAEFITEDAQARKRFEAEQASERLVQQLQAEALAQEYMHNVSEERAKELDELMMRMTETDWLNLMMQVGTYLKELLPHVYREDLLLLRRRMNSWQLYPKSSIHVLDLTNGKTVYMFVDKVYPIRATLLERMLRHRLTVPPSYCRDVVVAGNIIQTVQDGLRQAYECLASAHM
ncbi:hypothetical protein Tco_1142065, partial [Tanacetum coccineum]